MVVSALVCLSVSASEMTCIVSGGALNSTHSLLSVSAVSRTPTLCENGWASLHSRLLHCLDSPTILDEWVFISLSDEFLTFRKLHSNLNWACFIVCCRSQVHCVMMRSIIRDEARCMRCFGTVV